MRSLKNSAVRLISCRIQEQTFITVLKNSKIYAQKHEMFDSWAIWTYTLNFFNDCIWLWSHFHHLVIPPVDVAGKISMNLSVFYQTMQIFLWFRQKLACLKFFRRTQKMPGFLMQYGRLPWTLPKTCKTEQLNCVTLLSKLTFSFSHFLKVSHDLKQDMWVILEVIKKGQSSQARIFLKAMCILSSIDTNS